MKRFERRQIRTLLLFALLISMLSAVPVSASSKKLGTATNVKAVGINGGVRVSWRRARNAKSYYLEAIDYKGKKRKVTVPGNVTGGFAHEYDKYRYHVGKYFFWDVKKLDHNYNSINTWMNKNNKLYKFRVVAVGKSGRTTKSEWVSARPFNVEKNAPEQDVNLPGRDVSYDPETASEKLEDKKKFSITKVDEGNRRVKLRWKNKINNFKVSSYEVRYKRIYTNESRNKKTEYKVIASNTKKTSITIRNLKNEQEYSVIVTATGTYRGKTIQMEAEERVIPHSRSSRRPLVNGVITLDPYTQGYDSTAWYKKNVAEAFANYGNGGTSFKSNTPYFLWLNMYQLRLYIFRKTVSDEWRLWKDMPCGIGWDKNKTPSGIYILETKDWVYQFGGLHVQWLTYYGGYSGNAIHTETYETMNSKMLFGQFESAGCVRIDRVWAKWVYEKAEGSTFLIE